MAQHQRLTGPTAVNAAANFSPEMVQGAVPPRNRQLLSKSGWTHNEVTFAAAMTPDMFGGWHPDTARIRLGPKIPAPIHQATHDPAAFNVEMSAGWHPDQNRAFVPPKVGWSVSQPTHTAAAFSIDMAAGSQPSTPNLPFRAPTGWTDAQVSFLVQMTPEMFAGWHPDAARLLLGAKIPLPTSQPTHVSAPFTVEMAIGQKPDAPRLPFTANLGWTDGQLSFVVQMTPEMFAGWRPDTGRVWLAPKIPLPLSQPTHTSAAFGVDMVQGSAPDRPRLPFRAKLGWLESQLTFIVQMTPDMFAGWLPARFRQTLGPKIPLPISQTTHTSAPFTPDMVQGSQPSSQRNPWIGRQLLHVIWSAVLEFPAVLYTVSSALFKTSSAGEERTTSAGETRTTSDGDDRSTQ